MKVSGFEDLSIEEFQFSAGINQHSICQFKATIEQKDTSQYISMARERKKVNVMDENNSILMSGIVYEVNAFFAEMYNEIQVTVISSSIYAEERFPEKRRIFQDTTKTPKKMLDYVNENQSVSSAKFQIKGNSGKMENQLPEIWVQDCSINDFAFVQHVCAVHECVIIPEPMNDLMKIGQLGEKKETLTFCEEYAKTVFDLQGSFQKENSVISFSTLQKISIGSMVQFSGSASYASALMSSSFFITEMKAIEEHDYLVYTYTGVMKVEYSDYLLQIPDFMTETALVTNNKDDDKKGRIQVNFDACEDVGEEKNRFWVSYLSPYVGEHQNGFIMLPDLNDRVQLLIGSGKCQALGSERTASIQEDFTDPAKKFMVMETDKITEWSAEQIAISNREKSAVILKADSVTVKQDDRSAVFDTDTIVIQNGNKSSVTLKNDKIIIKQNQCSVTLDENITAQNNSSSFQMEKSKISIKQGASSVTIDNSIALKTGSSSAVLKPSEMNLKSGKSSIALKASEMSLGSVKINFQSA